LALPQTLAAYEDCYLYYERATASPRGIRILLQSYNDAHRLRSRMNQARVLERREAARLYPPDSPQHGKSANDKFCVSIAPTAEGDGKYWLYVQLWEQQVEDVEELE
jgi:hypothetical protein